MTKTKRINFRPDDALSALLETYKNVHQCDTTKALHGIIRDLQSQLDPATIAALETRAADLKSLAQYTRALETLIRAWKASGPILELNRARTTLLIVLSKNAKEIFEGCPP